MKHDFGFSGLENLLLAALNGFVYIFAAWKGGKFAQKFGYTKSLYIGFAGFCSAMLVGMLIHTIPAQILAFAIWTISVCFIWPAIEATVCAGSGDKLADMVGYYNIIWAMGSAVSYFSAGMMLEKFGMQSLFVIPLILITVEAAILTGVIVLKKKQPEAITNEKTKTGSDLSIATKKNFMFMAWLANPLAYIAINTILPLAPTIADRIGLSTGTAGIVCSVWMFARFAAFVILWRWTGWHYRFKWLVGSLMVLLVCFTVFIFTKSMMLLLAAQIGLGLSIGLIYYSSLFYSMNASDDLGSHGGLHEAMIGAGLFIGPVCGSAALTILPSSSNAGIWSVSGLLTAGLAVLLYMKRKKS
jgi:predicted MFS family arabinose efflux permease